MVMSSPAAGAMLVTNLAMTHNLVKQAPTPIASNRPAPAALSVLAYLSGAIAIVVIMVLFLQTTCLLIILVLAQQRYVRMYRMALLAMAPWLQEPARATLATTCCLILQALPLRHISPVAASQNCAPYYPTLGHPAKRLAAIAMQATTVALHLRRSPLLLTGEAAAWQKVVAPFPTPTQPALSPRVVLAMLVTT